MCEIPRRTSRGNFPNFPRKFRGKWRETFPSLLFRYRCGFFRANATRSEVSRAKVAPLSYNELMAQEIALSRLDINWNYVIQLY